MAGNDKASDPRVGPLETAADVKREAGKLYRRAVRGDVAPGDVAPGDASKLAHVLALVMRVVEGSDLEARLAALEAKEAR
jgi:hypothetical protein